MDQRASITENLLELTGRPGSPLLTEGLLVMATEVGAGEHTTGVLTALAAGRTKHGEIKDAIRADPTRTLDRLVEMRIIERLLLSPSRAPGHGAASTASPTTTSRSTWGR